ncbi:MAG: SufD family Fe-S cluster assembly protein [Acidimicrobiales bacterium]|nr:SufD family Fe-S cluster assembly protein [Acidimicrobiales bacterium]
MTTAFSTDAAGALPGPEWLVARRRGAAERFTSMALPSPEEEVWRYSRIGDLELDAYRPSDEPDSQLGGEVQELVDLADDDAHVVVTVDGRVVHDRPGRANAIVVEPTDADASSLGAALTADDALVELHDAFCIPVEIDVPAGTDGGTVVVIHRATTDATASFPRLVVHAGQDAQVSVIEVFTSPAGTRTLGFPVTELVVDRDARLQHASVQVLGDQSWQIGRVASTVGQNATLLSGTATFGGDYARLRTDTILDGRGAHGDLYAGYFGTGSQLLDFRTFQDHVAPDTTSNLLFKGALGEKGASVYTGLIKIRPDARGAEAYQTNRNLKLSDDAWAESVPNLEIENNEVQCSHASTVGPVDPEQLFYLESRGVPTDRAERLIVKGIFDEVLARLPLAGLRVTGPEQPRPRPRTEPPVSAERPTPPGMVT